MKTIVWDVDDVLNNLMGDWFHEWRSGHPDCSMIYERLIENPPHKLLGIPLEKYQESLDEFRIKSLGDLKPVPEVLEWFQLHGDKYRHIALTAVPIATSHLSAAWVFKHFGVWIRSFNIVPTSRKSDPSFHYHRTKKDFLMWIHKADIFVDDNVQNIEEAKGLDLTTLLFPRPWNKQAFTISESLQRLLDASV